MMNIGDAAQASGVSAKMIRYYESIGLIAPAGRTESNYRVYSEFDVHTLRFIKRARSMGFAVDEMGQLLQLWRDRHRASRDVKRLALQHVGALEEKITELRAMVGTLRHLAENCHGDARPDCPILDELSQDLSRAAPPKAPASPRAAALRLRRPSRS
jgi:MerR family copper efflux transcriptional regulator